MTVTRPTRLLTIPPRHPYVDAVRPVGITAVLSDRTRGWEPDPFLRPEVVSDLATGLDLVHLHFGFDDLDADGARRWLRALTAADLPLVFTAHDLRNPHHPEGHQHDEVLHELMTSAAAVLTLTSGAAQEIESRWGREAQVIAHPSLTGPVLDDRLIEPTEPGLVTLHLKSLRRNVRDPVEIVRATAEGAEAAGGRLRVDLHPDAVTPPLLTALRGIPGIQLEVHARFTDLQLERYLRRAHVTVLPYRWGTHSGWLELARDLGTRVVAPSCGYYAEQWSEVVEYVNDERRGLDPESLGAAVVTALSTPPPAPADLAVRHAERHRAQGRHQEIYSAVLDGRASVVTS